MNWTEADLQNYMARRNMAPADAKSTCVPFKPLHSKPAQKYTFGEMNKVERLYRDELESQRLAGLIDGYRFESFRLKLAPRTHFTPDFAVYLPGQIEMHEVKTMTKSGRLLITDDGNAKLKIAAEMWPTITFKLCIWRPATHDWLIREVGRRVVA